METTNQKRSEPTDSATARSVRADGVRVRTAQAALGAIPEGTHLTSKESPGGWSYVYYGGAWCWPLAPKHLVVRSQQQKLNRRYIEEGAS